MTLTAPRPIDPNERWISMRHSFANDSWTTSGLLLLSCVYWSIWTLLSLSLSLSLSSPLLFLFMSLQQRMSVRMDSFSATTKGVYRPSGGATTMTTARTTVMKKTVVSVQISVWGAEVWDKHDLWTVKKTRWVKCYASVMMKRKRAVWTSISMAQNDEKNH